MKGSNRKSILILSFALVVVMLGYGMVIPIFPFYMEKLGASGSQFGLLIATYALMEFLCAPVWGSVSDRVGRKPILLVGVLGNGLSLLLFGFSTQLWMLFAARVLGGVLSSATFPTALAYVSDHTLEEERGRGMGILGAAMGLGVILGPGLGGWMAAGTLSTPFYIAAGLSAIALLLIVLFLPASRPSGAHGRAATGKRAIVQVNALWRALSSPIGVLLGLLFLVSFGLINFESIFGLYAAQKFAYGPERVGTILAVIGVVSTVGKATLIGPLTKWWGEARIVKVSTLASSIGFVVLLLANTYPTILLATGLFILSKTLLRTALLSLASRRATVGQGAAMGLGQSFISLGRIAGPIWAGFAFDIHVNGPYLSGAAIMFAGFLMVLIWVGRTRRAESSLPGARSQFLSLRVGTEEGGRSNE